MSYKLSTISFVTFDVITSKLLLGNPPHTEANSFKSCKAENANSQYNRIAHALHTKDVSKMLCSVHTVMHRAHRGYKLSTISFVTFGVSKLILRNPPHTEANSFKSCKAENANSQCNRIAHALHTKDVSKLLCSAHTVRNISLVAKIIKHDRYFELRLEWTKSYRNYAHTGAMCWAKWHEWHLAKQIALVCAGFKEYFTRGQKT